MRAYRSATSESNSASFANVIRIIGSVNARMKSVNALAYAGTSPICSNCWLNVPADDYLLPVVWDREYDTC
jgi:hypothetical protein